ncbi:hypothetical protein H0H87_011596 [Tephrocybe sp. NHM501043]|nr:hypothetical protein H0H87_011596 [Tephrocybe sp. NHM501043]
MVKRSTDSDSEGSEHASQKRARTSGNASESDSDSEDDFEQTQNGKGKGKGKRKDTRFSEDVEEHGDTDNEEEEQEFENEHAAKILADLASKRKVQGGIAEHGIIERVEMHNFMCHTFLQFEFGPQINFIIGHNGSGKSAVLSAITVALGGKSNSTGRGNGLKSFIKEGCSAAEVTIVIKNQGEEAYKPQEYGKSISITRKFSKEGSSTWKIRGVTKGKETQTISTKKEELAAICDHMNIQVDNPMNVLTQDAARQFLSASAPVDKYKFFLRGTQLSQLSDEYTTCLANIKQTYKVLEQKREALPDLKTAFREATVRFEEAAKAREQKQRADELKKELAWAHVKGKEEELEAQLKEVMKLEARLGKIERSIEAADVDFQAATEDVTRYEAAVAGVGDMDDLTKERDRLHTLIKGNRNTILDFTADLKKMEQSIDSITKQIEDFDKKITEETKRMEANTQTKQQEAARRLDEARRNVEESQAALKALDLKLAQQEAKTQALKNEGMEIQKNVIDTLQIEIQNCQGMIQRAKDSEKNSLIPYGNNIKGVLDAVNKERWAGDKPVGPLGMFVKAKDPQKWGELLRSQLTSYLTAFAVTNAADRDKLTKLLAHFNNKDTLIIINKREMFDYSHGELPPDYLTVLRALEITDPYVLRVLINVAKIERILLTYTRTEAESMLRQLRGGGMAWTAERFLNVRSFPEGGVAITPMNSKARNDATSMLLTGRDARSEISHFQEELRKHEQDHQLATQRLSEKREEWNVERREFDALKNQRSKAEHRFRGTRSALVTLQQAANDIMPSNVASFEAAKDEAAGEKAHIMEQAEDVLRQKAEYDEKNRALLPALEEVKDRIKEFNQRKSNLVGKAQDAAENRMKAQHVKDHHTKKLDTEKAAIAKLQSVADVLQEEFTNWTEKALEFCERFPNPRKVAIVKTNLESVNKSLQEREKRHGATVEEMTIEVNRAKAKLDTAERDLKQMTTLNKALKASLTVRLQRWQDFRRHIALRCKLVFGYHLSHRGYYGKVLFNHDQGTLALKVVTDDQAATQQLSQAKREKDPRSLSGGEKSFSTICLLLSLWESIGCPLRCLDEFDVFMDAVNRRISMKMMIDTANSSDKKQYILITPQDMGNVQLGPSVKVNRMTDPERRNQS